MVWTRHVGGRPDLADTTVQQSLIDRAPEILAADDRILAAWLVGSFATGRADAYSDIDLHCLITDDSAEWFRRHWAQTAAELAGPLVLAQDLSPAMIGGYAITPDWLHLDLVLHPRSSLDPHTVPGLRPLYDRHGNALPVTSTPRDAFGEPYFPDREIKQFLYFLGNLPVVINRDERVLAHASIDGFRQVMITVMLAEQGVRHRGGAKRLNPFLTAEQRATLEAFPTASLTYADVLDALRRITQAIRQRGKQLAVRTGARWPQDLEDAALHSIHRQIGIDFT